MAAKVEILRFFEYDVVLEKLMMDMETRSDLTKSASLLLLSVALTKSPGIFSFASYTIAATVALYTVLSSSKVERW